MGAPNTRKIRFVCISDTHNAAPGEGYTLPKGDILIHAGDLTNQGSLAEVRKAINWLDKADFASKIVVAGNHDLSLDPSYRLKHEEGRKVLTERVEECRALVRSTTGITYLEHDSAVIELNDICLRVFGSPYSPDRLMQNWAFQYLDDQAHGLWSAIPADTDVLITHTPPAGFVDTSLHWTQGGCPRLAQAIRSIKPLLHICGHCHEGRGAQVVHWSEGVDAESTSLDWQDPGAGNKKQSLLDLTSRPGGLGLEVGKETAVVNASIMTKSFGRGSKAYNKPIVVDMTLTLAHSP